MMFRSLHSDSCSRACLANAAIVALTGCLVGSVPARGADDLWEISAVDGAVTVVVGGADGYAPIAGTAVAVGATLVTGPAGTLTLMRGGDSIQVSPNSEVTVPNMSGSDHLGVVQSFGELLYRMETRDSWNFEVRTPYLAATVKGTVFTVSVTHDQATVSVSEGKVHVMPVRGGRGNLLHPGVRASVSAARAHEVRLEALGPDAEAFSGSGRVHGRPAGAGADGRSPRGKASAGNAGRANAKGDNAQGVGPSDGKPHGAGSQGVGSLGGKSLANPH